MCDGTLYMDKFEYLYHDSKNIHEIAKCFKNFNSSLWSITSDFLAINCQFVPIDLPNSLCSRVVDDR